MMPLSPQEQQYLDSLDPKEREAALLNREVFEPLLELLKPLLV